jgi:putative lipoic acid-binding regulatory protein
VTTPSLLEFPTEFPIKVVGRQESDVRAISRGIVERFAGTLPDSSIRERASADGNFLALTYLIVAESQAQLDDIYRELSACEAVIMAL